MKIQGIEKPASTLEEWGVVPDPSAAPHDVGRVYLALHLPTGREIKLIFHESGHLMSMESQDCPEEFAEQAFALFKTYLADTRTQPLDMAEIITVQFTREEALALDVLADSAFERLLADAAARRQFVANGISLQIAARACDKFREAALQEENAVTWTHVLEHRGLDLLRETDKYDLLIKRPI